MLESDQYFKLWGFGILVVFLIIISWISYDYIENMAMAKMGLCYTMVEVKNADKTWEWEKCKGDPTVIMLGDGTGLDKKWDAGAYKN